MLVSLSRLLWLVKRGKFNKLSYPYLPPNRNEFDIANTFPVNSLISYMAVVLLVGVAMSRGDR